MPAAAYAVSLDRIVDRPRDRGPRATWRHDLVDHSDLDGLVDAAGDPLVLSPDLG